MYNNYDKDNIVYYNDRYDDVFNKLNEIMDKLLETGNKTKNYICMIVGIEDFKSNEELSPFDGSKKR